MNLLNFPLIIVAVITIALIGRYEIVGVAETAYRLDRWTGELTYIVSGKSFKVDTQIEMTKEEIIIFINSIKSNHDHDHEKQELLSKLRAKNPEFSHYSDKHFIQVISEQTGKTFEEIAAQVGYKEPELSILEQLRRGNPTFSFYSDKSFIRVMSDKVDMSPEEFEMLVEHK